MSTENQLLSRIHEVSNSSDFLSLALDIFHFQYENNAIYQKYCVEIGRNKSTVLDLKDIPFLPISFFKSHFVSSVPENKIQKIFSSSGTTGSTQSKHHVADLDFYKINAKKIFTQFYQDPSETIFLSLLPGYLERNDSSLVFMMEHFNQESQDLSSGFYLNEFDKLELALNEINQSKKKCVLLAVTHALIELGKRKITIPKNCVVMETGGMKGHGRELVREELHAILKKELGVNSIHSEYGMTELLSQAYSKADGKYFSPPWMKILIRDIYDPFGEMPDGKSGAINIIDLANLFSCSFIATDDLGKINADNSFEVLGRLDSSDLRGCNLLIA